LYPPQDNILEDSLRKESERIANSENLIQKIVYDCFDPDASRIGEFDFNNIPDALGEYQEGRIPSLPSPGNCDND
jgi:hypothetical protein